MTKIMLVCAGCGFTAFVEPGVQVSAGGWSVVTKDGKELPCCPACVAEHRCDPFKPAAEEPVR